MAQPGVAREPSMEEILASIRQIIESNEPGAGRAISASLPPVYGAEEENDSEIHLTVDDTYAGVEFPEPSALRPDPRFVAANSAGTAPEPELPARAMSLADVAARVRAASERSAAQAGQALRDMPQQFSAPQQFAEPRQFSEPQQFSDPQQFSEEKPQPAYEAPRAVAASRPAEPAPAPAITPAPQIAPVVHYVPEPVPVFAEPQLSALLRPAIVEEAPALPAVEPRIEPPVFQTVERAVEPARIAEPARVAEEPQPALLSQTTGLQVARSFEELAAAIDGAAERRSLDEIAEDMLRPMLREWLDDNLPTLVERLVREEIERVARGPRR
jgi:uncharacterized protein